MRKIVPVLFFFLAFVCAHGLAGTAYAQAERDKATLMKEHMTKMKNKSPEKYQRMVENAKSGVTDCISCHIKSDDKKSHFRFVVPQDPVHTGD